jgi:hypothetical protein
MCNFLSWIEKGDQILFLTYDQIYNTPRGEILRKSVGSEKSADLYGHNAIRKYYDLPDGGKEKECEDFYTPSNFPGVIVDAIKKGKFGGLAAPRGLLLPALYADYEAKLKPLYADYEAKCKPLYADYQAKLKPLDADYEAKRNALYADYEAKRKPLYADYQAKLKPLDADYQAKRKPLYAEFWKLFSIKKNRAVAWR